MFGCVGTDSSIHFWNYQDQKIRYLKTLNAGSVQSRIWYLPLHKLWITAGRDYVLRSWEIMKDNPLVNSFKVKTSQLIFL